MAADGSLLSISQYQTLFAIRGTTYGGDGVTTFALPDLRGRTLIGASATSPVGTKTGTGQRTLTVANLPAHAHTFSMSIPSTLSSTMLLLGEEN